MSGNDEVGNTGAGEVEGVGIYVKDRLGDRQPISVITVADIKNIEEETISFQQTQIDTLNNNLLFQNRRLVDLNRQIIFNQQECTNSIVEREKEIMIIINGMKNTLKYLRSSFYSPA